MINVTKVYLPNRKKFDRHVDRIYKNNWVTNKGELVRELEEKLCDYLGVKHLVVVANGTLALQVAYKVLGISGEVITTPFSFVATTSSLIWEGFTPIFSDIDAKTFNINPSLLNEKVTNKTSAIVPTHVFGNPCEHKKIHEIAKKHNLKIIYDAAHAFGVKTNGNSILNQGDMSILSFHATKLFHTIEGGAIITNSSDAAEEIRLLINFGINGKTTIDSLGINAKMNEFEAAMGLSILDDIDFIIEKRKDIWNQYETGLKDLVEFQKYDDDTLQNYSYAPIILPSVRARELVEQTLEDHNISARRYFYPSLDSLTYIENDSNHCTISRNLADRILCLPMYPSLDKDISISCIIELVKQAQL